MRGLSPYVSCTRTPFSPTKMPPPSELNLCESGIMSGRGGYRPPSYQKSFSAGRFPTAGTSGGAGGIQAPVAQEELQRGRVPSRGEFVVDGRRHRIGDELRRPSTTNSPR